MRLAVVTNILAPYRIPLFEELARRCGEFLVVLLAARHDNRDWAAPEVKFATRHLPGILIGRASAVDPIHINRGTWRAMREFSPDVVLGGGFTPAHLSALAYCRMHRRRYISWGELHLRNVSENFAPRRWVRHVAVRASDGWIASSSDTRDAFIHYGADPARVKVSLMPVRNALFRRLAAEARASGADLALRRQFGGPMICGVGRLVAEKGWCDLLRALPAVRREFPGASLVIAGEGPDRTKLEALARSLGLDGVHLIGARDLPALSALYAAADVFAFPTHRDTYGAVIAEAMSCGAPTVASVYAGATRDLVIPGRTGFVVDPHQVTDLARGLCEALRMTPEDRARMVACAADRLPDDDSAAGAEDIANYSRGLCSPPGSCSSGRATQDL